MNRHLLFLIVFLLPVVSASSQVNRDSLEQFIKSIDQIYGINDVLVNGYPYIMPDPRIKGHPFLFNNGWNKATIYIDKQEFTNKPVRYEIQEKALILKADFGNGSYKTVQLNKHLVDSFRIKNRLFVSSSVFQKNSKDRFYFEIIYRSNNVFVRKFNKHFKDVYNTASPNGKFSEINEDRYIIANNTLEKVNSRGAFIRFFPKKKRRQIRRYFRNNGIRYSRASRKQLIQLSNFCFNLK